MNRKLFCALAAGIWNLFNLSDLLAINRRQSERVLAQRETSAPEEQFGRVEPARSNNQAVLPIRHRALRTLEHAVLVLDQLVFVFLLNSRLDALILKSLVEESLELVALVRSGCKHRLHGVQLLLQDGLAVFGTLCNRFHVGLHLRAQSRFVQVNANLTIYVD